MLFELIYLIFQKSITSYESNSRNTSTQTDEITNVEKHNWEINNNGEENETDDSVWGTDPIDPDTKFVFCNCPWCPSWNTTLIEPCDSTNKIE